MGVVCVGVAWEAVTNGAFGLVLFLVAFASWWRARGVKPQPGRARLCSEMRAVGSGSSGGARAGSS